MARKKADETKIKVGNITDVSGEVIIAGRDVYKGFTAEQVSLLLTQITSKYQRKPFDGRCPYKGLDFFEEEDAELFFGREKLVDDLVNRVKESRTVFITGPSGSGKSSLVRAGLIHALKQGATKNSGLWLYETIKPGRDPIESLTVAFSRLKSPELANYFRQHVDENNILHECAESALSNRKDQRLVLFIDQFEEVFTQVGKEKAETFINILTNATVVENGRITILFSMRSDFVSNCASYPQLNDMINQEFMQIGAMQPDELVSAIAQPALRVGLQIDPDLIAQIINDMQGEPGILPLMQFALKDLFDSRQEMGGLIALALNDYLERGGIHKALERHADTSFAKLDTHEQELARSIFSGLIEIGRGTQDTRRTALFAELIPSGKKAEDVETIIEKLADARLITTDERAGKDTVTISHEKLIDAWPWLKKLVNENRDVIALQNEITTDAKEWDEHNQDESYLYTGARLANAREKLESQKIVLSGLAQIFVESGIGIDQARRREEEIRRQTQLTLKIVRQRALYLTFALIMALITVGATIFLSVQLRQQAKFTRAYELAGTSIINFDSDPDLSLHLAMQSLTEAYTLQGEEALRRALSSPTMTLTLLGHSGAVYSVSYAHDGKRLVTASADGTARIWEATTGHELSILRGHSDVVNSVAFSPNDQLIATASADKTVRIWDATTGEQLRKMNNHSAAINTVAFSPDGEFIVTASDDKTARLWKVADGREVRVLAEHKAAVRCAVFSPNGKLIATGGNDQTINFWDATTGDFMNSISTGSENVNTIAFSSDSRYILFDWLYNAYRWDVLNETDATQYIGGHTWYLTSVAFDPFDGRQVVTASSDHTVRIWNTESGDEIELLRGQSGAIYSAAFDPTGDHLATASEDGTVRIWNIGEWRKRVLIEPADYAVEAAYSSDGRQIATTDSSGMIRIWEAQSGHELKAWPYQGYLANRIHFSPDDKQIITASDDSTWGIWDAATGEELYRSDPIGSIVSDARFNHDGTLIITTQRDNLAIIWDAKTKLPLVQFKGHSTGIWTGTFSPDGRLAVTASADQTARVWEVQTGNQLHVLSGHSALVTSAAFSSDGKRIVTTSVDGTARIWDADTGALLLILRGHAREVTDAAFSPTDPYVATSSRDHTVILWNAETGDKVLQLFGHSKDIFHVTFSPDGKYLLTASFDGTARIYPVHFEDVLDLAKSLLSSREFTCAESVKYLHERLVCPTPTPIVIPIP